MQEDVRGFTVIEMKTITSVNVKADSKVKIVRFLLLIFAAKTHAKKKVRMIYILLLYLYKY